MFVKTLDEKGSVIAPPQSRKLKCGSVILKPGGEVGEHSTHDREELLIILEGNALVVLEGEKMIVKKGQAVYIPPQNRHNVKNPRRTQLKYCYITTTLN